MTSLRFFVFQDAPPVLCVALRDLLFVPCTATIHRRNQCAVEPVWHLPEIARRFGVEEMKLRETLFTETNMMYPELVTRSDIKV